MDEWRAITLAERSGQLAGTHFPQRVEPLKIHIAPDLHYPFHNQDVVDHIIDLCDQSDTIIQIGDGLEAYGVSSHKKNPGITHTLQDEAKAYREGFWDPIRSKNPDARLIQIFGNHENRIARYCWEKAPALYDTPGLHLSSLIEADRLGIEVSPSSGLVIAGHRVKHGDVAKAVGSARAEMLTHRYSGISAHTHRCEHETMVDAEGHRTDWYSIGHACRPELMEYLTKPPNWQLSGGITLTVYADGHVDYQEHRLS